MKLPFCVACGSKEDLQHHHLVTRIEGGADDDTNLITLMHRLPPQAARTANARRL